MLKKTIKYEDYNGVERTEDFHFNFNQAEVMEMEMSVEGGYTSMINRITAAQNTPEIAKVFKELVLKAYGVKSDDGKRFMKSPELSKAFEENPAYSIIYMELATDDKLGAEFVNGLMPKKLREEAAKQQAALAAKN